MESEKKVPEIPTVNPITCCFLLIGIIFLIFGSVYWGITYVIIGAVIIVLVLVVTKWKDWRSRLLWGKSKSDPVPLPDPLLIPAILRCGSCDNVNLFSETACRQCGAPLHK